MFCKYCGKEIKEGVAYCPYCGNKQKNKTPDEKKEAVISGEESQNTEPSEPENLNTDEQPASGGLSKRGIYSIAAVVAIAVVVVAVIAGTTVHRRNANNAEGSQIAMEDFNAEGEEVVESQVKDAVPDAEEAEAVKPQESSSGRFGSLFSSSSRDYKAAYEYASENAAKIVMAYMQNADAIIDYQITYPEDEFEEIINNYDPSERDAVEVTEEADEAEADLEEASTDEGEEEFDSVYQGVGIINEYQEDVDRELFLDNGGINAYFADSDLVNDLKDLSENTFFAKVKSGGGADTCTFECVNGDYAIVRSNSISSIVDQLNNNCGYYAVTNAVEEIESEMGSPTEDDLSGRKDALEDYLQEWEDALTAWDTEFLEEYGLTLNDYVNNGSVMNNYIYMLIDKDSNILSAYVSEPEGNVQVGDDGKWELYYEGHYMAFEKDGTVIYDLPLTKYSLEQAKSWLDSTYGFTTEHILGLSPSENTLIYTADNDIEHGDYTITQLLSPDGSMKEVDFYIGGNAASQISAVTESPIVYAYGSDYTTQYPENNTYTNVWLMGEYIDLETGDTYDYNEWKYENGEFVPKSSYTDKESEETINPNYAQIGPDYYMDPETYDVYSATDTEKPETDLSIGQGVKELAYNERDDVYWVLTNTDYFYKVNGDFSVKSDPINTKEIASRDGLWESTTVTPYGIFFTKAATSGRTAFGDLYEYYEVLYDENGEEVFHYHRDYYSENYCGFFTYTNAPYLYNLNNFKMVRVSKKESLDTQASPSGESSGELPEESS